MATGLLKARIYLTLCVYYLLAGVVGGLPAQLAQPAITPQEFSAFALHHRALLQEIATRQANNPTSADGLARAAEYNYNLATSDFANISGFLQTLWPRLDEIDREALAYKAKAGARPDLSILRGLYERRLAVLAQTSIAVNKAVTPQGWQNLVAYIKSKSRVQ